MQKNQLKRNTKRIRSVQIGRGGKRGKTSGKGHKGQKARAGHKIRPEIRDQIKKLPKLRGRGINMNKSIKKACSVVKLSQINEHYKKDEKVTPKTLFEKGLVRKDSGHLPRVKIVNSGELKKSVIFTRVNITTAAKEMIEKAGAIIK